MKLWATFAAQFWTCLKIIGVDSTFAGKDFITKIRLYRINSQALSLHRALMPILQ